MIFTFKKQQKNTESEAGDEEFLIHSLHHKSRSI